MNSFILRISWVSLIGFCLLVSLHLVINCEAATSKNKPYRIISLSPSLSEILFSIGAGEQVIAVDNYSNYPPEAPITSLSSFEPNMEAMASFRPDLVLLSYDIGNIVKGLNIIGVETMLLPAPKNFEEILLQIRTIGEKTGNIKKSNILANKMKSQMKDLVILMQDKSPTKVYHEIDENYYSASSQSFIGNIYELLNLNNIADQVDTNGSGYPKLSPEYILLSNPDIIILPGKDTNYISKLKKRPGWSAIDAVKKNQLLIIDADLGSRWGPRIIEFAKAIVKGIVLH